MAVSLGHSGALVRGGARRHGRRSDGSSPTSSTRMPPAAPPAARPRRRGRWSTSASRFGLIVGRLPRRSAASSRSSARLASARVVLVTDASPAAGAPPGRYELDRARHRGADAGGTRADTRRPPRRAPRSSSTRPCAAGGEHAGVAMPAALEAASERPAGFVGLSATIERRAAFADLVLLTPDGHVQRAMRRGRLGRHERRWAAPDGWPLARSRAWSVGGLTRRARSARCPAERLGRAAWSFTACSIPTLPAARALYGRRARAGRAGP